MTSKPSLPSVLAHDRDNRKLLYVIVFAMIALITDVSFSQVSDLIVPQSVSLWGITLFSIISVIYVYVVITILKMVNKRITDSGIRVLQNKSLFNVVKVICCLLIITMLGILIEILFTSSYYKPLLAISVALSYGLTTFLMGLLAYRLFSWVRTHRSVVVLIYAIASVFITINAIDSLIFFDVVILDVRQWMFTSSELADQPPEPSNVTPQSPVIFQTGFSETTPMYIVAQIQTYSMTAYFIVTWAGTIMLLRHYIKKIGKIRFGLVTTLPIIFFLNYYITLYKNANPTSPINEATPFIVGIQFLLLAWAIIICGILFGFGFRSVAKAITGSSNVRNYMLIAAYGYVLFFNAAQATVLQAGYPPFGLANVSMVGLSSYLIFIGVYHSAVSVSQDSQLIRNIKKMTMKELELIRDLGLAQSQQTVEKNVMKANKEVLSKIVEEKQIESSFTDADIKEYLTEVIKEVRRREGPFY
jgi:hypothetical protein